MQATLEVGPQGGNLGDQYWTFEPADLGKITTFCISFSGDNIYSIQFTYNNQEGKPKDSKVYGVPGGAPSKVSSCYIIYLLPIHVWTICCYCLTYISLYLCSISVFPCQR